MNDAKNVRKFLMSMFDSRIYHGPTHTTHSTGNWGFKSENIVVLTDDTRDSRRLPTKANILGAMKWLVKDAKAHDSLFFHCERAIYIRNHSLPMPLFQTLVTVGRSAIRTGTKLTDTTKVRNGGRKEYPPLTTCQSYFLSITKRGMWE